VWPFSQVTDYSRLPSIIYLSCYIARKEQIEKAEEKERLVKEKEEMMKMAAEDKSDDEHKESSSSTTLDSENNGLSDEPSVDQVSERGGLPFNISLSPSPSLPLCVCVFVCH